MTKFTDSHFLRFLVVGGLNTLITYLIYLLLISYIDYRIAFTGSFVMGLIIAYVFNSRIVFDISFSWYRLLKHSAIYLSLYILALVLLSLEVELMDFDRRIAPLLNVALLVPLTFSLNKYFLTGRVQ